LDFDFLMHQNSSLYELIKQTWKFFKSANNLIELYINILVFYFDKDTTRKYIERELEMISCHKYIKFMEW
jgi:hypothetical protein